MVCLHARATGAPLSRTRWRVARLPPRARREHLASVPRRSPRVTGATERADVNARDGVCTPAAVDTTRGGTPVDARATRGSPSESLRHARARAPPAVRQCGEIRRRGRPAGCTSLRASHPPESRSESHVRVAQSRALDGRPATARVTRSSQRARELSRHRPRRPGHATLGTPANAGVSEGRFREIAPNARARASHALRTKWRVLARVRAE